MADRQALDTRLVSIGCGLLIAAAVAKATYSGFFEPHMTVGTAYWPAKMALGFAALIAAYVLAGRVERGGRAHAALLALQSVAAMGLIIIYPSFIVTVIMVVIAWQIGWAAPLRIALAAVAAQSVALALVNCVPSPDAMNWLVLITTFGFEFFAVSAAHLARREAEARAKLARANDELRATQALVSESVRMAERVRISRDLHDVLGHNLTSLAIHLDVASRTAEGQAARHLNQARDLADRLLSEVRGAVNQVRIQPVDLREILQSIADGVAGLDLRLVFPEELFAIDAPRADTILRCVQELITNALRHADATELVIELRQADDGALDIMARDDGRGGAVAEGAGLAGMRERFELLGGRLSFSGSTGRGLTVSGRIPAFGALRVILRRLRLADDQVLIRSGLRALLALFDGIEVVAEAEDGAQAIDAVLATRPDVLLLDVRMPKFNGVQVVGALAARNALPPTLWPTTFEDDAALVGGVRAGALSGFSLKGVSAEMLVEGIRTVAAGERFLYAPLSAGTLTTSDAPWREDAFDTPEALTARERDVLKLLTSGISNSQIAAALQLGEGTVRNHVSNILSKLGVADRTKARSRCTSSWCDTVPSGKYSRSASNGAGGIWFEKPVSGHRRLNRITSGAVRISAIVVFGTCGCDVGCVVTTSQGSSPNRS